MQVVYNKTYYEQLVDILEDGHFSDRDIKQILMPIHEYEEILKRYNNPRFLSSINSKVYIESMDASLAPDELMTVVVCYQVVEKSSDRTARLRHIPLSR
jgi:hypothetical protein